MSEAVKVNTFFGSLIVKDIKGKEVVTGEINVTKLIEFLESDMAKDLIRPYKDKNDKEFDTVRFVAWPDDPDYQNDFRTNSIKVDTFIPEKKESF